MDKETDVLILRLIENAKKIQMARYEDLDELFNYTKAHIYPKNIAELAEAFGMMAVKLEAREYDLERKIKAIEETSAQLRISNDKLEEYSRTLEQRVDERTAEIVRIASIDDLTQLLNRKEILKIMRYELSKRNVRDLSLVFFDIDHFKNFNDTYGHQAGDEVLRLAGRIVRESIRESDAAGRYGGEEFLVVLPESDGSQARMVAERIRDGFAGSPFVCSSGELAVTASFGIVSLADNGEEIARSIGISSLRDAFDSPGGRGEAKSRSERDVILEMLIRMCDDALYKSKRSVCRGCGFESEKTDQFKNGACPQCGTRQIEYGRNRIKIYVKGEYF